MNSTKGVIRIIKHASNYDEYNEYYYFVNVDIDDNGHLMAVCSGNIWDAMKFIWNSLDMDEDKRIESIYKFVENCFIPKNKYTIELIPIKLEYEY